MSLEPVPQRARRQASTVSMHGVEADTDASQGTKSRASAHTMSSSGRLKGSQNKGGSFHRKHSAMIDGVIKRNFDKTGSRRGSDVSAQSGDSLSTTPKGAKLGVPLGDAGSSGPTTSTTKWNFEKSNITLDDLKRLKEVFDKAAESCDGKLDEKDFLEAFAPILGGSMTPEQLSLWFTHIDASDDGSVEWEEFSTFLLGKGDGGDESASGGGMHGADDQVFAKDSKTLSVPPTESSPTPLSGYNHSEIITSAVTHPRLNKYYTGSQDGTVRAWEGSSLEFQRVLHNSKAWVTSICLGRHDSKLCVSSVDRVVTVYETHSEKLYKGFVGNTTAVSKYTVSKLKPVTREEIDFRNKSYARSRGASDKDKNFQEEKLRLQHSTDQNTTDMHILSEMDYPAMCMLCPPHMSDCVYLGLSSGSVQAYRMLSSHTPDLLTPVFNTEKFTRDTKWDSCNGSEGRKSKLHKGPITSMQCTNKADTFITTGSDGFIRSINIEKQKISTIGDKYCEDKGYLRSLHAPPIHSSAWIDSLRMLATSGTERHVSLWSPNSHGPPMHLKGHLASVSHVCSVDDENYLVSIDVDKCIKVWDIRTLRTVQTTVDYDVYRPSNKITALIYDNKRKQLVTGCAAPVVWPLSKMQVAFPDPKYHGHQRSVISVCFNPRFHKLATADADSVRLWAIDTGELLGVWSVESLRSATSVRGNDESEAHYIFEMIFAENYKRLIIGLSSGSVLLINFASGQLITEMLPMRPGVYRKELSFAECTDLEHYNSGGHLHVACLRGHEIFIWKDGEAADEKRLDHIVRVYLDVIMYNLYKWVQEEEIITNWRNPLPLCVCGMGETFFLVGTDSALILVYNSLNWDLVTIFGQYEPAVNIMCIGYNAKKDIVISGRSDGRINVNSFNFKDRNGSIFLRDTHNRNPILQTLDIGQQGELVVAGDEEGYVYVCNIANFFIADLPPFTTACATLDEPAGGLECICYYQAHNTEILRIQLVLWNGTRYVATSASDCQSRLFTAEGDFIGYLGCDEPWDLVRPKPPNALRTIPAPLAPDQWSSLNFRPQEIPQSMQLGDCVDSGPNTPTGTGQAITAMSFLPDASQFTIKGKEARKILHAQQLQQQQATNPTAKTGGPAPPGKSFARHAQPASLVPPKSRAQLIKQTPRFASPTRTDETLLVGTGIGRAPCLSYKAPPLESDFSQNKGRTIEHQKVRLTRMNVVRGTQAMDRQATSTSTAAGTNEYEAIAEPSLKLPAIVAPTEGSQKVPSIVASTEGSLKLPSIVASIAPTAEGGNDTSPLGTTKQGPWPGDHSVMSELSPKPSSGTTPLGRSRSHSRDVPPKQLPSLGILPNLDLSSRSMNPSAKTSPGSGTAAMSFNSPSVLSGGAKTARESIHSIQERQQLFTSSRRVFASDPEPKKKSLTDVADIMSQGCTRLFIYKDFKRMANKAAEEKKQEEERLKQQNDETERPVQSQRGGISQTNTAPVDPVRPGTPIETKLEMWKQTIHQKADVSHNAMSAIMFTKLGVPAPDEEAREDIATRRHKMPTQLLLENDPLMQEMKRPPGHGGSDRHHAGTLPSRTARF